jgi:hypothetical protein
MAKDRFKIAVWSAAGLVHLKELKGLTELNILNTQITDTGLKELRSALPKCEILR